MKRRQKLLLLAFPVLAGLLPMPALAATFCVSSVQALRDALDVAESNGEHDTIRLTIGTYAVTSGWLNYFTQQSFDLTLQGGWVPGCVIVVTNPAATVLDGQGTGAVLRLFVGSTGGDITLRYLTVRNGVPQGAVMPVELGGISGWAGTLTVENNVFTGHTATAFAPIAIQFTADADRMFVRNNLFADNLSGSENWAPIQARVNGIDACTGVFNNNTVAGNGTPLASADATGGVRLDFNGAWCAGNNIFWGNSGHDLELATSVRLVSNNIGSYTGEPAPGSSGNGSVNPRFVDAGAGNYRLAGNSLLRDVGNVAALGGIGSLDVAGLPRVVFNIVDVGAYELQDRIFRDDFD